MATDRAFLERLELAGYKSIRKADIDFTRINVIIGSNGAGKSNLISFFSLLQAALSDDSTKLFHYVGRHGGANALLHLGSKTTNGIRASTTIRNDRGREILELFFGFGAPNGLYFSFSTPPEAEPITEEEDLDRFDSSRSSRPSLFEGMATYHLADTSLTSAIRTQGYIEDNRSLHPNGRNLAAILYRYMLRHPRIYERIRATIRKVAPSFDDFFLSPQIMDSYSILLNWRQVGSDYLLGPHQLSDGTLRAMVLITVLLQPAADLPDLLIFDEPELGLHPYALSIISGLIGAASLDTQVIVATQSPALLDEFEAEDVIVVDSVNGTSQFRRLDQSALKEWLEEYSIGELWKKNVLGGGPMS